jgi:tetratricopeptide (TPR) repeat protein
MEMRSKNFDIVALFNQGLEEHNAGNLSAAKKMYHEILSIQPDHCEANHNIGIVLVAENELEKALEFFKFALTASPNVSLFWANYIDTLAKLERIVEAKALIKAAKNSGMSCENIEAISHRLDTENQEPLAKDTREIDEFIIQQKFDDAIEACLSLLETYPRSGILNITLGKCYFELGQMELAKSSFIKATEYSPLWNISFVMLGQVYSSQGDLDEAINSYKKSLKIKPGCAEAYYNMGNALMRKGDLNSAVESYKKALKTKPDYAEALNNMGLALKDMDDLEAAIKSYKQALVIEPDCAETYYNMGNALMSKGDLNSAVESYKKAHKIKPGYAETVNNMGTALKNMGDLEAAIKSYKKALGIKPDYVDACNNMGVALNAKGDLDGAMQCYKKALKIKPDCAEAYTKMGNALQGKGNLEAAIDSYQQALNINPETANALENIMKVPTGTLPSQTLNNLEKKGLIPFKTPNVSIKSKFQKANLHRHQKETDLAFKLFLEANILKKETIKAELLLEQTRQNKTLEKIKGWSPHSWKNKRSSIKKIFILGPSRSGKTSLEKLLCNSKLVHPFYEYIKNDEFLRTKSPNKELEISDIFYGDENKLKSNDYKLITSTLPSLAHAITHLADSFSNSYFVFVSRDKMDLASNIFISDYVSGNHYSYDPKAIMAHIRWYDELWEIFSNMLQNRVTTVSFDSIMKSPNEIIVAMESFLSTDLLIATNDINNPSFLPTNEFSNHFQNTLKTA